MVSRGLECIVLYSTDSNEHYDLYITALACSERNLARKSHLGHFRVIDLIRSTVDPKTLGINVFVS